MPIKLLLDDLGEAEGEGQYLPDQKAVEQLLTGLATMHPEQKDPPFAILDALEERKIDLEVFGPSFNQKAKIKHISEEVFSFGQRQTVVDGCAIHWIPPGRKFLSAGYTRLSMCSGREFDLLGEMRKTLRRYVKDRAPRVTMYGTPTDDEKISSRLINAGVANFIHRTRDYFQLRKDWFEFHQRVQRLEVKWREKLTEAIRNGHILVSEELGATARMVHPSMSGDVSILNSKAPYTFCFSANLPTCLKLFGTALAPRRKAAGEWIKAAFEHFQAQGRRASISDLKLVAMERFDLTEEGVRTAWKETPSKPKVQRGEIPSDMKVSINEITELD